MRPCLPATPFRHAALAAAVLALPACGLVEPQAPRTRADHCSSHLSARVLPPPAAVPGAAQALTAAGFSEAGRRLADDLGLTGPLATLVAAERQPGTGVGYLLARQEVTSRILLATLEVQSVIAVMDCEDERADQLQGRLARLEADANRRFAIAGVIIGATTAIATGALAVMPATGQLGNYIGIGGGIAEAGTAAAQIAVAAAGELRVTTNFLREIRDQPAESRIFPAQVWRHLTARHRPGAMTIAEQIVADWRAAGLLPPEGEEGADDIFAADGMVDQDRLNQREEMADLLVARIRLMNRELRELLGEVLSRPVPAIGQAVRTSR